MRANWKHCPTPEPGDENPASKLRQGFSTYQDE
jgi:hypothetical protein